MKLDHSSTPTQIIDAITRLTSLNNEKFGVAGLYENKDYSNFGKVFYTLKLNTYSYGIPVKTHEYSFIHDESTNEHFVPHLMPQDSDNAKFIDYINECLDDELKKSSQPKVEPSEWDKRKLRLAMGEVNTWSKDPSTKVSAVVFKDKNPIAVSYNGLPPGIEDTHERLHNRELKYKLVQHAEANAISTCAKMGIATDGAEMAVTLFPCSTCAGMMISAGIKRVIVQEPSDELIKRWGESFVLAKELFAEAGVEVVTVDLSKD